MKTRLVVVVGLAVLGAFEPGVSNGATSFAVGDRFSLDTRTGSGSDVTAVDDQTSSVLPTALSLAVAPSPFNAETTIRIALPSPALVTLEILNGLGQVIATPVVAERFAAGTFLTRWDGRDGAGREVASGVHTVVLRAGAEQRVQRAVLVR